MKTIALGFAAALTLGLASFSVPAAAFQASPNAVATPATAITTVRYVHRHHRKVCTVKKKIVRDRHGHRKIRKVRVCR